MSVTSEAGGGKGPGDLSLEQWLALNDEITALVRAGLPLDVGMEGVAGDDPGRLGTMALVLARRLERGEGLAHAIEAEGRFLPPVYRAVVVAGARSGRLGAALEGLATAARNHLEVRRALSLALFYPLIVLSLAYVLVLGLATFVLPKFEAVLIDFRLPVAPAVTLMNRIGATALLWWWAGPVVLAVLLFWWAWSGRARAYPGGYARPLRWVPWMRGLLTQSAAASYAELAALLIEHGVPLPETVELAGQAAGDTTLARASTHLAARLRQGESSLGALPDGFPPLLAWLMAYGERQGQLAPALRHAGESYRRRAMMQAELTRTFLPVAMTVVIGMTAVLGYALLLFVPFSTLLHQLTESVS